MLLVLSEIRKMSSVFQGWEKRHWRLGKKTLNSHPGKTDRETFQGDTVRFSCRAMVIRGK